MVTAIQKRPEGVTAIADRVDVLEGVSFSDLVAMGDQLVRTGFLPDHIRTGVQFTAIVMAGRELGMTPMRALRSLQLVKGKVLEDAASQLSRFKAAGGRATFEVLDETRAVLRLRHPNGDEHVETWTIDDARRAESGKGGLLSKFPKAMLRSRCITAGLKSLGWDGAVGNYDPAELVDEEPAAKAAPTRAADPEVLPPAPKVLSFDVAPAMKLARLLLDAVSDEDVAYAAAHVEACVDESDLGKKVAAGLNALVDQASAYVSHRKAVADGEVGEDEDFVWRPATPTMTAAADWMRKQLARFEAKQAENSAATAQ